MRFSEIIARVYRDVFTHSGPIAASENGRERPKSVSCIDYKNQGDSLGSPAGIEIFK